MRCGVRSRCWRRASSDHGFHVIAPTRRKPWTTDIATASLRLAKWLRTSLTHRGLPRSNYIGGGTGLDVRSDLGTLNMSDVPVAMIEIGNMRNARDAHRMTSRRAGRATRPRSSGEFGPICDADAHVRTSSPVRSARRGVLLPQPRRVLRQRRRQAPKRESTAERSRSRR